MKNFKSGQRSDRGRGDKRFGGRSSRGRDFGGRDHGRPTMHQAVCDECGNACEVPFQPSGDKPIYCSNCFKGKQGGDHRKSDSRSFGRAKFAAKRMFTAVCDQCGQDCEVPFQPTGDKPIYCSNCFGSKSSQSKSNNNEQLSEQLIVLNTKLDKVLEILEPNTSPAIIVKDAPAKKTAKLKSKEVVKKATTKKKKKKTV